MSCSKFQADNVISESLRSKTLSLSYPLPKSVENPGQFPQQAGQTLRKSAHKHTGHKAAMTQYNCSGGRKKKKKTLEKNVLTCFSLVLLFAGRK